MFRPAGDGPFPAVLYNHGSERLPGTKAEIGELFAGKGYVVFVPHRRGQGRSQSQGAYIMDALKAAPSSFRDSRLVELQESHQADVIAALSYLKGLPFVDGNRIAVAGCSFGGIQTVLASEKNLGLRAAVAFAPAAMTWAGSPALSA
jgi:dienelactone hydrolase